MKMWFAGSEGSDWDGPDVACQKSPKQPSYEACILHVFPIPHSLLLQEEICFESLLHSIVFQILFCQLGMYKARDQCLRQYAGVYVVIVV